MISLIIVWLFIRKQEFSIAQPSGIDSPGVSVRVENKTNVATPQRELSEPDKKYLDVLRSIYSVPIVIEGRVEDETGMPVVGAKIEFSLNDKYFKDGTKGETVSNTDGRFQIQGKGASVYIHVQKDGFYRIPEKSYGTIRAGQLTTAARPVVFMLKKIGMKAKLIRNEVWKSVPIDGTVVGLDLKTPSLVDGSKAPIQVRVWIIGADPQQYQNYEWRAELRIPGGGFLERVDEFAFEAPEPGYEEKLEFFMSAKPDDGRWLDGLRATDYFIKLGDGSFARGTLQLSMLPDRATISFKTWWNEEGGRNLEAGANWFGKSQ